MRDGDANIQVVVFPYDQNDPYQRSANIVIDRYGQYLQVKQGNEILGSVRLVEELPTDEAYTLEPMVIVMIRNGYKPKITKT